MKYNNKYKKNEKKIEKFFVHFLWVSHQNEFWSFRRFFQCSYRVKNDFWLLGCFMRMAKKIVSPNGCTAIDLCAIRRMLDKLIG